MRICLIGNSHAGAWKEAWDALAPRRREVALNVFAAAAPMLKNLESRGGVFATGDAGLRACLERGGAPVIDPAAYDMFVVVLAGYGAPPLVQLYGEWRADSHAGREGDFTLVSDDCFRAAASGLLERTVGARICRELAAMTSKPVYAAPQPMPREAILAGTAPNHEAWRLVHRGGDAGAVAALFAELFDAFCAGRAIPLPQPPATLHGPLLTRQRWAAGAKSAFGAGEPQPEEDMVHMNAAYGTLCLDALFAAAGIAPA
jgi:hypothetical protein